MRRPLCKLVGAAAAAAFLSPAASALNIALTNDDGWPTYGIHALYNALTDAGHNVVLAAPLSGESGSGAAIDFDAITRGQLVITQRGEPGQYIYSVGREDGGSAEPATSGAMATSISKQLNGAEPDLLIAGINDGGNVGAATPLSGTVGATIVSISRILGGTSIPAIAISTDGRCEFDDPNDWNSATIPADIPPACEEVAGFIVDLVDRLQTLPHYKRGKSGLLPDGLALNINYPAGEPRGAKFAVQGNIPYLPPLAAPVGNLDPVPGQYAVEVGCITADCTSLAAGETATAGWLLYTGDPVAAVTDVGQADVKQSDVNLYYEGYITVVPIEANYTASSKTSRYIKGTLRRFLQQQ
ncbi:MAG: 5'/3'-nucleotidase SurE [Halieaceae bacterium]|nr:5'/3'-nucleotidase SurE [Halieaceae bacterium]